MCTGFGFGAFGGGGGHKVAAEGHFDGARPQSRKGLSGESSAPFLQRSQGAFCIPDGRREQGQRETRSRPILAPEIS